MINKQQNKQQNNDLSHNCDFNDENPKNNCWECTYFLFPIGCMFHEKELNKQQKGDNLWVNQ